uniref:Glycosyltransferase involved in cell wall bisynthesis n=1 Tax=Candidatus Kentrum sp. MB TaxID=2138164 RepID=A0A450XQW2_9GAMM|nr:MAG: Glycosyltransferase involved in cell wall bisynthesis [Candidatus Kentron sp. MB]VFK31671.1 MAG: Glycosyltransferase involved in cell wall bisynthesis [Candidatus Kentron sp. MB]VFK75605.1 MAG: Glycosyltransferase involved in cell wall bisynthesis [Candidatus Kentron sp. MB]
MHIVQTLPELRQGGVERGTVELNRELVKRGHRSTVISAGGALASRIEEDGGQHILLDVCAKNPLTAPFRVHRLRNVLRELRPHILHARSRVPAWLCHFANKGLRIPFVTTVHGFNSVNRYSAIMTRGERVICVSNPIEEFIRRHYHTPADKISVIHRGVDPDEFNPNTLDQNWIRAFRQKHRLTGRYIVTAVGRITELKDYETFIRAIAGCAEEIPTLVGIIVGSARKDKRGYFERLQGLVCELDMKPRILFVGSQRHMAEIYASSDLLVSCSRKPESFGRTLIEAMAMNTPVIATRHGGALDIIEEGIDGELFAPGNVRELREKIITASNRITPDLRARTLRRFSLRQMVDKTIHVYRTLIDEREIGLS